MQLSLFDDTTSLLIHEMDSLKKSQANVRRGLFKRHSELQNEIKTLKNEIKELKNLLTKEDRKDLF